MARPREHNEETRRLLLDSAEALLGAEGVAALSVRRLAEEVGTTTRAIYSLFGSKQGLVHALYRIGFERLDTELASVPASKDPLTALRELGHAYRRAAQAQPNLYDLMFRPPVPGFELAPDDYLFARSTLGRLREAVAAAVDQGLLDVDVESTTMQLWALVHGLASLELSAVPSDTPFEHLWDAALANLLHGLQTEPMAQQ